MKTLRVSDCSWMTPLGMKNVQLRQFFKVDDARGPLWVAQHTTGLPFEPKRFFFIRDVPPDTTRGGHAHKELQELLVCLRGSVSVTVYDGERHMTLVLDTPETTLHFGPLVWATQHDHSPDCELLVLASLPYRADDYIRSLEDFEAQVKARKSN